LPIDFFSFIHTRLLKAEYQYHSVNKNELTVVFNNRYD